MEEILIFLDTERRTGELEARGFNFLGMGVSGGEEGALWGPSLMPGGSVDAYKEIETNNECGSRKGRGRRRTLCNIYWPRGVQDIM